MLMVPQFFFNIPLFNVVIKMTMGVITDVVWDNDCYTCLTESTCNAENATYLNDTSSVVTDSNCSENPCSLTNTTDVFVCDPKFYITWFGTDASGKQLKSSNLSMSRFRQYAIGSLYNSAKSAFNSTIATLVSTYDNVANKTSSLVKGITTRLF